MKLSSLLKSILTLTIVLLLISSCTQDSDFDQTEDTSSFMILPIQGRSNGYSNYQAKNSIIDIANDVIKLEIPVPLNDYYRLNVYNVSSNRQAAILYIISRGKTDKVVDFPTNYIINDEISISENNLDVNLLENGHGLRIFVMNNSVDIDIYSEIFTCIENTVIDNDFETNCSKEGNRSADGPDIYKGYIIEN